MPWEIQGKEARDPDPQTPEGPQASGLVGKKPPTRQEDLGGGVLTNEHWALGTACVH